MKNGCEIAPESSMNTLICVCDISADVGFTSYFYKPAKIIISKIDPKCQSCYRTILFYFVGKALQFLAEWMYEHVHHESWFMIYYIRKPVQVVTCFSFIIFVYVRRKMIKDIASIEIVDLRPRSINRTSLSLRAINYDYSTFIVNLWLGWVTKMLPSWLLKQNLIL